jgi:hypothetical protein
MGSAVTSHAVYPSPTVKVPILASGTHSRTTHLCNVRPSSEGHDRARGPN